MFINLAKLIFHVTILVPSPPEFCIKNVTDSQFSLSWFEPKYLPGYLEEFEIVIDWELQYPIPNWCEEQDTDSKKFNVSGNVFEYDYLEVKPFTSYKIYMRAKTGEGWSNSSDLQTFLSSSRGIFYSYLLIFHIIFARLSLILEILNCFYRCILIFSQE